MHLKLYLVKNKIKAQDFAQKLGCSRTHLSEVMSGNKKASVPLARLIQALTNEEVTAEEVLSEYKEKNKAEIENDKV